MFKSPLSRDHIIVAIFMLIISLPAFGIFTYKATVIRENRPIAHLPMLSLTTADIARLPQDLEAFFNDHFMLRNLLIRLNARKLKTFKVQQSTSVVVGRENWLFLSAENSLEDIVCRSYKTQQEKERWLESLTYKRDLLKSKGIEFRLLIIPDKHKIYPEMLPDALSRYTCKSRWEDLYEYLAPTLSDSIVYLKDAMLAYKAQYPDKLLFYKSDTHWTHNGSLLGFSKLMESLGIKVTQNIRVTLSDAVMAGDMAIMLHMPPYEKRYTADTSSIGTYHILDTPPIDPRVHTKLKANYNGGGGVISTFNPRGSKTLLVFRDSFTNPPHESGVGALLPLLSSTFRKVVYVWTFPDDQTFQYFIEREKPDIVIEERVARLI